VDVAINGVERLWRGGEGCGARRLWLRDGKVARKSGGARSRM